MVCPFCGNEKLKTTNSRKTRRNNQVWRRRQCDSCGRLFSTREYIDLSDIAVIHPNGDTERYSRAKLTASLLKACDHRPDQADDVFALVDTVEKKLIGNGEIPTSEIKKSSVAVLANFDEVASVKYSSYY